MDRIINFFPEDRRQQLLMDLSLNLRAVISQRLLRRPDGEGRRAAAEILINTPLMADLILKGDVPDMKPLIAKSREAGMQTFDQALFDLIEEGAITVEEGLRNADSVNDLRLRLKLESKRAGIDLNDGVELSMEEDPAKSGMLG
jgi:twitching motility protein PilU